MNEEPDGQRPRSMVKLRGQIVQQEASTPKSTTKRLSSTLETQPKIIDPTSSQISLEILQMDVLSGLTAKQALASRSNGFQTKFKAKTDNQFEE